MKWSIIYLTLYENIGLMEEEVLVMNTQPANMLFNVNIDYMYLKIISTWYARLKLTI